MPRQLQALALLVVLCFMAPHAVSQTVTLSEMLSFDKIDGETFEDEHVHDFSQRPEKVRFSVDCRLKRGELAWRVESPDGKVLLSDRVKGKSKIDVVKDLPGLAGEWRLVIDAEQATGSYRFRLKGIF
jgi:hypothetical protein